MLGDRIRKFREQAGMSQKDLAKAIQAPVGLLKEYESGKAVVPDHVLFEISEILDIPSTVLRGVYQTKEAWAKGVPSEYRDASLHMLEAALVLLDIQLSDSDALSLLKTCSGLSKDGLEKVVSLAYLVAKTETVNKDYEE